MNVHRATLFFCWLLLHMDACLSQRDCSEVDCPPLQGCIQTLSETGACCPVCTQRGCTCEGYQHYDCVQAGFLRGKVPEGKSYFVDFGSTECSCPLGGGKISCRFIPCPETPPNCIDIVEIADGCVECKQIGCTHGNKKYEAGHSFNMDQCQVCHCPNEGGKLMCSPIPGCDLRANKPTWALTTEDGRQTSPVEPLSKLPLGNTLPLYKQDPPSFGTEDYDYTLAGPTSSKIQDLARLLESTTAPLAHSLSPGDDAETRQGSGPESSREAEVIQTPGASPTAQSTQRASTENHSPPQEASERTIRHDSGGNGAAQDAGRASRGGWRFNLHKHSSHTASDDSSREKASAEQTSLPTIQFTPTSRAPVRMREDGGQKEAQSLHGYQDGKGDAEVSTEQLMQTCCETGEKWASANGHCNNMEPPTRDRNSICWTAQQQCCRGSRRQSRCLAGVNAARTGNTCQEDAGDKCGIDSYKECCDCCSLGLQLRREGHRCEAQRHLGFHCTHVFLTCCEGDDRHYWHSVRERPALDSTPRPEKVSYNQFPKEAFSIGEGQDVDNAVDDPVEVEDMDECLIYNICHHRCVNTMGSYRCECFPGYVMQEDAFTCVPETLHDQNRLTEDDGVMAAPTSQPSPPTQPAAPPDPCEGNGPCEQHCASEGGRPQCSCFPGFSLRADGRSCEDINECSSGSACQLNERCVNTAGSYACHRPITCPPGYHINKDVCEDIDECVQQSHACGVGFQCVNVEGSFRCDPKPRCAVGFDQDGQGDCVDVDECGAVVQPCSLGFDCINTAGSYVCQRRLTCGRGYHASPDGSRCIDVDECQSSQHRCGKGQMCNNLPGSYRCECQTGYQYDSFRRTCVDVNECWRYPGRLCAQTCENTPGSYQCSCTSGFRLSSDGKNCEDVNECSANPCSQECANIYGSYQCYCRKGYYLREDGNTCDDIDECSQSIGHLCTYKCVNVPGSYQCACPEHGYSMSPNGRSCRDIDECSTGAHNCSLAETCYNIQGGYRCLSLDCPPNYRKVSDTRCERIGCANYLECQSSPLRITYYYLSFQSNIVIPAQIFRIGPSPAYAGDNVIVSITHGNEENYFSTRKLNAYTGAVYLNRQVPGQRDFSIIVEMKLWRQGTFTTFQARIFVFITANLL